MADLRFTELTPDFGSEVTGFSSDLLDDSSTRSRLQELFDTRGVLVFRDLEIDHASQVRLAEMLVRNETESETPLEDRWYISNRRPSSAAPYGRLQFHADMMWAEQPCEIVSLYAVEVEPPATPTTFASAIRAWATLPQELRSLAEGRFALHTAGTVRRGDLADVLVSTVENPPTTVKPLGFPHPRTGDTLLYACEQMTKEIVGLPAEESEHLLEQLLAHAYDEAHQLHHHWRTGDLVAWDNLAVQHARSNVLADGPARTLRKVASPMPSLTRDEMPSYGSAR